MYKIILSFLGIVPQNEPPSGMTDVEKKDWEKAEKEKKKEKRYQTHEAASYWYKIVSIDPNYAVPETKIYKGVDAAEHMLNELQSDAKKIYDDYIKKPKELNLTPEEKVCFKAATNCHICGGQFKAKEKKVILFHCYYSLFI